jgi:hypothetical protein
MFNQKISDYLHARGQPAMWPQTAEGRRNYILSLNGAADCYNSMKNETLLKEIRYSFAARGTKIRITLDDKLHAIDVENETDSEILLKTFHAMIERLQTAHQLTHRLVKRTADPFFCYYLFVPQGGDVEE